MSILSVLYTRQFQQVRPAPPEVISLPVVDIYPRRVVEPAPWWSLAP